MTLNLNSIPAELKSLNRWTLWRKEIRSGQATKIPVSLQGVPVSVTAPKHWLSFEEANRAFNPKLHSGVGFVFHKLDGFVGVDLDGCVFNGVISNKALKIIRALDSYSEISPSGNGVHVILKGVKHTSKSKIVLNDPELKAIEVYNDARYFTVTGAHIGNTPLRVEERQAELNALCEKYFSPETHAPQPTHTTSQLTDEEIIDLCRKAKNAHKFEALFERGDVSAYSGDESAADAALCAMFAFYTRDEHQIERLFFRSALARRAKWRERADYRHRTIQNAIAQVREHYTPTNRTSELTKYPLERLNGNSHLTVPEPIDESELDESEDETLFDAPEVESLLFTPTLREVYEALTQNDPPEPFAYVGTLIVMQSIIGDAITIKIGSEYVRVNDFFCLLGESGVGKSTVLNAIKRVLYETGQCFAEDTMRFTLPSRLTERGLKDILRAQSDVEREKGIQKAAQTSGTIITDEFLSMLAEMRAQHSSGLLSLLLELWQGEPVRITTARKNDGVFEIPPNAISMISAITPEAFWRNVPPNSESNGFFSRLNLVWSDEKPERKTLFELATNGLDNPKQSFELVAKRLSQLHRFACYKPPIIISHECTPIANNAIAKWSEVMERFSGNEAITSYGQRLQVRLMKYSLLIATIKAFEESNEDRITVSPETVEQAAQIVNFFFANFVKFVLQHRSEGYANDTLGRIKQTIVTQIKGAGSEGLSFWQIFRKNSVAESNLKRALDELVRAKIIELYERRGKGKPTLKYRYLPTIFPPNSRKLLKNKDLQSQNIVGNPTYDYLRLPTISPENPDLNPQNIVGNCEKNKTLTYDIPENSRKLLENKDLKEGNIVGNLTYDIQNSGESNTSETLAKRQNEAEYRRLNIVGNDEKKSSNVASEPTVSDVPKPETATSPELSDNDLLERVLSELPQGATFTAKDIRTALEKHCNGRANAIGHALFPSRLVRLGTTDKFVFRENSMRPLEYRGLVDSNGDGIIPSDVEPF